MRTSVRKDVSQVYFLRFQRMGGQCNLSASFSSRERRGERRRDERRQEEEKTCQPGAPRAELCSRDTSEAARANHWQRPEVSGRDTGVPSIIPPLREAANGGQAWGCRCGVAATLGSRHTHAVVRILVTDFFFFFFKGEHGLLLGAPLCPYTTHSKYVSLKVQIKWGNCPRLWILQMRQEVYLSRKYPDPLVKPWVGLTWFAQGWGGGGGAGSPECHWRLRRGVPPSAATAGRLAPRCSAVVNQGGGGGRLSPGALGLWVDVRHLSPARWDWNGHRPREHSKSETDEKWKWSFVSSSR